MVEFLKQLFKARKLTTNFDSYNHEASSITSPNIFNGLRYEISKTISPFLQISSIGYSSKAQSFHQYFTTLSTGNSIFQFCFDNNRNYQFKSSFITGSFAHKIHSIVSSKREIFNQFESMYNSPFYSIGLKLISPAFEASNLIYIINYWRSLGRLCVGAEVIGMKNELGISFSTRLENEDSIYCFNIQRFNLITLSFYKRMLKALEIGAEVKKSKVFLSTAAGLRIKSFRNEIKCAIDQRLNLTMSWNERLSENINIDFGCEYDWESFDYGIGINYES